MRDANADADAAPQPDPPGEAAPAPAGPTRAQRLVRLLVVGVVVAGLAVLAARKIDGAQFLSALRTARPLPLVLAAVLALAGCILPSALRAWLLTEPLPRGANGPGVNAGAFLSLYLASCAAHNLLPAPAGEVFRVVRLRRLGGYLTGGLVASQLVEKVLEALSLGLVSLGAALLGPLPGILRVPVLVFAIGGSGGAAVLLGVGWRASRRARRAVGTGAGALEAERADAPGGLRGFVVRLGEGLRLLRSPGRSGRALLCSLISDLCNVGTVALCLYAVGVTLPLHGFFLAMLAARLANLLPTTPSHFGVQEASVVAALSALGVPASLSLAAALLHHIAHFAPVTLWGAVELRRHV